MASKIDKQSSSTVQQNESNNSLKASSGSNSYKSPVQEVQQYMHDQSYFGHLFQNMSSNISNKYLRNQQSPLLKYDFFKLNQIIQKNLNKTSAQFQDEFKKNTREDQMNRIISVLPFGVYLAIRAKCSRQAWQNILKTPKKVVPLYLFALGTMIYTTYVFNYTNRNNKRLIYKNESEIQKLLLDIK